MAKVACFFECLGAILHDLGWWALAAIVACVVGGSVLAVAAGAAAGALTFGAGAVAVGVAALPFIGQCLGYAIGAALLAALIACFAACK